MLNTSASPHRLPRNFALLVTALIAGQTFGTTATMTLPALAPKVAQSYGVHSSLIGYQISVLAAGMLFSLVFGGNLSRRWGACRVTQVGLTLMAGGALLTVVPHLVFLLFASIALGLGYGLLTPSASHLLMRFTPANRRNVIFSIKQTGVPLGGVIAAAVAPSTALAVGWQWTMAGNAAVLASLLLLLEVQRARWDDDREPRTPLVANPLGGVAIAWNDRALRPLSFAGACFVAVQICLSTFTVVLFAEETGYSLVQAGLVLMVAQVGGVIGRVFWGWLADRTGECLSALSLLALVLVLACVLALGISPSWPVVAAYTLFFVIGATASGWNGAFLAEVAKLSPRHAISSATGGSLFFVNVGKLLGPLAFTNVYAFSTSYATAFASLAVPSAAGLACLVVAQKAVRLGVASR